MNTWGWPILGLLRKTRCSRTLGPISVETQEWDDTKCWSLHVNFDNQTGVILRCNIYKTIRKYFGEIIVKSKNLMQHITFTCSSFLVAILGGSYGICWIIYVGVCLL